MLLFFLSVSPILSQEVDCDTLRDLGIEIQINPNTTLPILEGDEFCIDFIATGLTNITLFQFSLGFDPNVISFLDDPALTNPFPGPGILGITINTNEDALDQGKLPIIWQHDLAEPTTAPDGSVIMTACFRADVAGECSDILALGEFTNNPPFQTFATADYDPTDPLGGSVCGDIDVIFNTNETEICIDCERLTITDVNVCNSNGCLSFTSCGGRYPVMFDIISSGPTISGEIDPEGEIKKYPNLPSGFYVIEARDADGVPASWTVNIDRTVPEIQMSTIPINPRCSNTNDGSIQYMVTGGMPDYNLLLSNGVNYQGANGTMENLVNGSYDITVTDELGCESIFPDIVLNTDPILLDIEVDTFTCLKAADGQIRVKATGGTPFPGNEYDFNNSRVACWEQDDPMNVSFVFIEEDTCFNLQVKDALGCPVNTCIKIPIRNRFQFEFDTIPPTCNDLGYTSTIDITSGERYLISLFTDTGDLVQTFGNNSFQENLEALSPGNYRWQLQELMGDMCIENFAFTIPDFSINPIEITTAAVQPDCGQENGSAIINVVSGTPNYSYNWEYDPTRDDNTLNDLPGGQYNVTITDGRGCTKDTFVDLLMGVFLTIEGNINRDLDCNDNTITAELEVSFDGFPENELVFEWFTLGESNLSNGPILETDTAGVYFIAVNTLAGDCLVNDTLEILDPGTLDFMPIQINPANCDPLNPVDGSIEITNIDGGSGVYNCRWYLGDLDTPFGNITDLSCSRDGLDAGLYLIEIIDNMNGCKTLAEINLFSDDDVAFDPIVMEPTCPGDSDGTIAIGGIPGGPALTCTWADPDVVAIGCLATNLTAGSYTVNIEDINGCEKDTTFILEDPVIFTAEITDNAGTSCIDGTDGTATVMVTSNPENITDFTFLWSNGDQDMTGISATNMALSAGADSVFILDGKCSVLVNFSTPEPTAASLDDFGSIFTNCVGSCDGTVTLTASGGTAPSSNYSFFWEADGITSSSRNDLCTGEHLITIFDENGCEFPDTIYVLEPDSLFVDISEIIGLSCRDSEALGSITAEASGGCGNFSYAWNNSGNSLTPTASDLAEGSYIVTVTDDCGCTETAIGEIEGVTPIFAELEITGLAACPGDQVCLGINQNTISGGNGTGYTFTIGGGALGDRYPIDTCIMVLPGPHLVNVFDFENNCSKDFGLVEIPGPPEFSVNLGPDRNAELGDSEIEITAELVNTRPVVNISWEVNEDWECIDPSFCETISFLPTVNSFVTVIVTDESGCTAKDELLVNISALRRVYFPTAFIPDSDVDNRFMIQTGRGVEAIEDFIIYDKWGNKMFELPEDVKPFPHSKDDGWDGRKNNRNCESGVYVWIANVRFSDDLIIPYSGQITLIR